MQDETNTSDRTVSTAKALEEKNEKEISLAPTTPPKPRRRRWFGSSKEKERTDDSGHATGSNVDGLAPSRPVSIQESRNPSQHSFRDGSTVTSDSASLREKDSAKVHDHLDRWATRAAGGTERAEREFGLSDEVNMALS